MVGGGFSPLSLSPNRWLDASQLVDTPDGTPMAFWQDMSGNGNDARQLTSASQPTYKTAVVNGKPAIEFRIDDYMYQPATPDGMSEMTIFIVFNPTSLSQQQIYIEWGPANVFHFWLDDSNSSAACYFPDGEAQQSGTWSTGWQLGIARYASPQAIYYKNTTPGSAISASGILPNPATLVGIGAKVNDSGGVVNFAPFDGYIAEIILYDRGLSDAELAKVQTYLLNKYAIS